MDDRTPPGGARPDDQTQRVLVVEDDVSVRHTFFRMLSARGYSVSVARDVEDGLLQLDRGHFDAVLVDFRMPRTNGLAFLRQLRAHHNHADVPVAVITGDYFLPSAIVRELSDLGAAIHFKPLGSDDLADIIGRLLRRDQQDGA
jgi:DNA-binding response OmpR family regulator